MTAKGSKTCCCNGCEKPPQPNTANLTFIEQHSWQTNCCSCVPEYACLTVIKRGTPDASDTLIYSLYCPTTVLGLDQPLYKPRSASGTFLVDGVTISVAIHFYVRDGVCYLCFLSPELGLTKDSYDNCVTINDAARSTPNFFCKRLSDTDAYQPYGTDRDLGQGPAFDGIGTILTAGGYDFVLARADHVAITPRPNCLDSYGNQVIDDSPIKDKCCNCTCICRCACLTKRSIAGTTSETACLDENNAWVFPSGSVVALSSTTYDRTCYLSLTPDESGTLPADVSLGGKCPRPTANWSVNVPAYGDTPSHTAWYEFQCSGCGNGCSVDVGGCCGDGRTSFPRTIFADVTTSCPDCPSFTVPLAWHSIDNMWIGEVIACGRTCRLTVSCSFTVVAIDWPPCTATTAAASGPVTCSPISGTYSATSGGIGCCGGSLLINPTIEITLYE